MHTDLNWQRTLDRQTHLRREARRWRLRVRARGADTDPVGLTHSAQ